MAATEQELVCPQAPPGQTEFLVSVPLGVQPGMAIQTTTPDGQVLTFTVPDDFTDGQMIPVFYTPLGRQQASEIGVEPPPSTPAAPSRAELRSMFRAFGDAKDRWKIDGQTLKGFYLHSESSYLYCWDQPSGILYEFQHGSGNCQAVWSSAIPTLNAEIWTVLPLPPTDPASLQSAPSQDGSLPNLDAFLILTIAHESGRQLPMDVLKVAAEDFCARFELQPHAKQRLQSLPAPGQFFIMQNFRCSDNRGSSKAFIAYVEKLLKRPRPPWGKSAFTLVVNPGGAIIGRSCPDLNALCREDPPERLAQAHCKIMSEQDRFFICDLNTTKEGTLLDSFPVYDEWVGPLKSGSLLTVGPLRIKVQLSEMAKDTPLPSGQPSTLKRHPEAQEEEEEVGEWQRKVYRRTADDDRIAAQRQQQEYKDRAELRRQKSSGEAGSVAIDALMNKYQSVLEAEKRAEEEEESRVEMPTMAAQREANMGIDGSFLGGGGMERAGIGFHTAMGAELIPNVLDPRSLSAQEASRLKTQMRFEQAKR